jgi:heme exporter protein CcmD
MNEIFYMDGFWAYVWSAFALTTLVMAGMALLSCRPLRAARRHAVRMF